VNPKAIATNRPAETGGALAAAIVVIISAIFDIDDTAVIAALTIVVGAIPGIITWIVTMRQSRKESKTG